MNTPAQCGAIKPPKTDIYSEAPQFASLCAHDVVDAVVGRARLDGAVVVAAVQMQGLHVG